ncbi:MAG TPA: HTH-type transcriptional repressor FabR [Nevskiaceae bacterium]|nr:HTH-type transcriptional repressor FabR [Nevskiaceae bacterium]
MPRSQPPAAERDGLLATRGERKQRTREALLDAALRLMAEGRSFTSLGLREITREAGVVPTSFYRHFRDLDELGLALVDDGAGTLRRLLREARARGGDYEDLLRRSVAIYRDYVREHRLAFLFVASERSGGSPLIRAAIRTEVSHFASELAQDLRRLNLLPHLSTATLVMVCGLVVDTMLNAAGLLLDLPESPSRQEEELLETFVRQLRLIFLGAAAWRDDQKRS